MQDPREVLIQSVLLSIVRAIAEHPEDAKITADATDEGAVFTIDANPRDIGKIIGMHGHVAKSMRIIAAGVSAKHGRQYEVIIRE